MKNFHVSDDPALIELYLFLVKCALFLWQDINNYSPVIQAVPSNLEFLENVAVGTVLLPSITVTDADESVSTKI